MEHMLRRQSKRILEMYAMRSEACMYDARCYHEANPCPAWERSKHPTGGCLLAASCGRVWLVSLRGLVLQPDLETLSTPSYGKFFMIFEWKFSKTRIIKIA